MNTKKFRYSIDLIYDIFKKFSHKISGQTIVKKYCLSPGELKKIEQKVVGALEEIIKFLLENEKTLKTMQRNAQKWHAYGIDFDLNGISIEKCNLTEFYEFLHSATYGVPAHRLFLGKLAEFMTPEERWKEIVRLLAKAVYKRIQMEDYVEKKVPESKTKIKP
ncbi:MAG: hypothetical protein WC947_01305 [Elusimicrobiota bacterium]